jgi:anti-anti-sigma regulatory factor
MAAAGPDLAVMLRAFEARLERALPFREDAALLRELGAELRPVLESLACAYALPADSGTSAAHEGFALFHLLARRSGLLGATPSVAPALARGVVSALEAAHCQLSAAQRDDLLLVALEGYAAGRDELRARELCRDGADDQASCELAPGCFAIFLAGAPTGERLEPLLDELSRRLFRADARSLLLDLSRLSELDEEGARALLHFSTTLGGLGTQVFLFGVDRLDAWRERLGLPELGAHSSTRFEAARDAALGAAGYELRRTRGRAREWLERVRPGQR